MDIWIPIFISLLALILSMVNSILNFLHRKRTLMATVITQQRFEWMNNVRVAISHFVSVYFQTDDIAAINEKKIQVELFLNPISSNSKNNSHQEVVEALNVCLDNINDSETKIQCVNELVVKIQRMLQLTWKMAKFESSMTEGFEVERDIKSGLQFSKR